MENNGDTGSKYIEKYITLPQPEKVQICVMKSIFGCSVASEEH